MASDSAGLFQFFLETYSRSLAMGAASLSRLSSSKAW